MVAAVELALELAREPGECAAEDGDAVDELVRDAGELLSPLAFVAKRRAISSWSAARTLMQKRPELRTAASVFEACSRATSTSSGSRRARSARSWSRRVGPKRLG